jgi:hypothetical protein
MTISARKNHSQSWGSAVASFAEIHSVKQRIHETHELPGKSDVSALAKRVENSRGDRRGKPRAQRFHTLFLC